jgi:hypothetical protein
VHLQIRTSPIVPLPTGLCIEPFACHKPDVVLHPWRLRWVVQPRVECPPHIAQASVAGRDAIPLSEGVGRNRDAASRQGEAIVFGLGQGAVVVGQVQVEVVLQR